MDNLEKISKLMSDLDKSEELRKQFEQKRQEITESGEYQSDGEIIVAAAKALGYDVTLGDFERTVASAEPVDPDELESVAGGWCWKNNECAMVYNTNREDYKGHNDWCIAVWHCYTAALHTDPGENEDFKTIPQNTCWKDYRCMFSYMDWNGNPI